MSSIIPDSARKIPLTLSVAWGFRLKPKMIEKARPFLVLPLKKAKILPFIAANSSTAKRQSIFLEECRVFFSLPIGTWFFFKIKRSAEKREKYAIMCMLHAQVPSVPEQVTIVEVSGNQFLPLSRTSP